jgi:hypothetical protein
MWTSIHSEFDVNKPFHMSDFMCAVTTPERYARQKNARPDYVALANDPPRANQFFHRLCIAQQTVVNCGISCIIDMGIYREVSSLLDLRQVVPPYALGARSCLARVQQWADDFDIQETVEVFSRRAI